MGKNHGYGFDAAVISPATSSTGTYFKSHHNTSPKNSLKISLESHQKFLVARHIPHVIGENPRRFLFYNGYLNKGHSRPLKHTITSQAREHACTLSTVMKRIPRE